MLYIFRKPVLVHLCFKYLKKIKKSVLPVQDPPGGLQYLNLEPDFKIFFKLLPTIHKEATFVK